MSAPNVLESLGDLDRLAFPLEILGANQFQRGYGWQKFCIYCHNATDSHPAKCALTRWLTETAELLDAATKAAAQDEVWEVDDFTELVELRGGARNGGLVRVVSGARELVDDLRYVITDERNVAGRRIARPRGRHK
jgi:hypothetical protein